MAFVKYPIAFIAIVLVAMLALLQTASAQENAANKTENAANKTLPVDVLKSAPIIIVAGKNDSAVVQPSNSSLVAARPDIASLPPSNISHLPNSSVSSGVLHMILSSNYIHV